MASPLKFDFSIDRLPNVNFFIQSANIPGITLPSATTAQGTPFNNIPWQGDRIAWGELIVEFKVDEDLKNWSDVYYWMVGIGFPENFKQYADFKKGIDKDIDGEKREFLPPSPKIGQIYGQAMLLVRSSQNNVIVQVDYQDVYPIALSELKFDTREESVIEMSAIATFKYVMYRLSRP
jgi:hypothetical protein